MPLLLLYFLFTYRQLTIGYIGTVVAAPVNGDGDATNNNDGLPPQVDFIYTGVAEPGYIDIVSSIAAAAAESTIPDDDLSDFDSTPYSSSPVSNTEAAIDKISAAGKSITDVNSDTATNIATKIVTPTIDTTNVTLENEEAFFTPTATEANFFTAALDVNNEPNQQGKNLIVLDGDNNKYTNSTTPTEDNVLNSALSVASNVEATINAPKINACTSNDAKTAINDVLLRYNPFGPTNALLKNSVHVLLNWIDSYKLTQLDNIMVNTLMVCLEPQFEIARGVLIQLLSQRRVTRLSALVNSMIDTTTTNKNAVKLSGC